MWYVLVQFTNREKMIGGGYITVEHYIQHDSMPPFTDKDAAVDYANEENKRPGNRGRYFVIHQDEAKNYIQSR